MPPLYELRRKLGQEMLATRRLYLDTKFWNTFCDVEVEDLKTGVESEALQLLRAKVRAREVVCPAEYYVLIELLRQQKSEKRKVTGALIDELSTGALIMHSTDRVMLELLRFVQATLAGNLEGEAPIEEVWTRPAFAIGHLTPENPGVADETHAWAVERTNETLWQMTFSEVAETMAVGNLPNYDREAVVAEMNSGKKDRNNQPPNFSDIYMAEILGALDGYEDSITQVSEYLITSAGIDPRGVTSRDQEEETRDWKNLIANLFQAHSEMMSKRLPTIHIFATLHANIRWDKARLFRPNDSADFGHAAAALAYCNCFATERSLGHLLRQSRLASKYGTTVVANCKQLVQWLTE